MLNPEPERNSSLLPALCLALGVGLPVAGGIGYALGARSVAPPAPPVITREAVACPSPADRPFVLVAFGQSNAASYGGIESHAPLRFEPGAHAHAANAVALDWQSGRCFRAADPLPGTDGHGASPWVRLAAGIDRPVLVVAFAKGGTTIADWAGGAPPRHPALADVPGRIEAAGRALARLGLAADRVIMMQGESDPHTSATAYEAALSRVAAKVEAAFGRPLVVAKSTLCQRPEIAAVRAAIDAAAARDPRVIAGPDFDRIASHALDRTDRCHLSVAGIEKAAAAWAGMMR